MIGRASLFVTPIAVVTPFAVVAIVAVVVGVFGCGGSGGGGGTNGDAGDGGTTPGACTAPPTGGVDLPTAVASYPTLSSWCLFDLGKNGADATMTPRAGVVPFDLNTPLFSDYARKYRWVFTPGGESASYDATNVFDFPVGTIFVKTFGVAADLRAPETNVKLVETRLIVRGAAGWVGLPYVWNDDQTDAVLTPGGTVKSLSWIDASGAPASTDGYLVPSTAQCASCHANDAHVFSPIGPKARNLNRDFAYADGPENQLVRWTKLGILQGAPADPKTAPRLAVWDDPSTGTLDDRARAWLEVNCAHCHDAHGLARTTGLYLSTAITDPATRGICKPPVAAGPGSGGFSWDIVPGDSAHSIVSFRMQSTTPGIMMPALGRSVVHAESVALVDQWIDAMTPAGCPSK